MLRQQDGVGETDVTGAGDGDFHDNNSLAKNLHFQIKSDICVVVASLRRAPTSHSTIA
jgi:hypothetical protein